MIQPNIRASAQAFFRLLREQPRRPLLLVLAGMLLGSLSEGFGITLLVPLLEYLQGAAVPQQHSGWVAPAALALGWAGQPGLVLLLLFVVLQGLRIGLQYHREIMASRLQFDLVDRLRERCFSAVLQSEWRWLSQRDNAQCANLLLTDMNRIGTGLNFFLQICSASALLLAYTVAALYLSWAMSLLVLAMGLLFAVSENGLRRAALALGQRIGQTSQVLHHAVKESLAGMKLAKILGNEQRHIDLFQQSMQSFRQQQLGFQRSSGRSRLRMQLGSLLILVALLYAGLRFWQLPVARLATLIFIFSRLMPMASQLQQHIHHWLHALPALDNANRLLAECRQAQEPVLPAGLAALPLQHEMVLQQVDFAYPGRTQPALKGINLHLAARTTTAIIGASGAGKSTLADMLMGLLSPDRGQLCIDGQILDAAARMHWRRSVAYVPQETILFNDSIRNNLHWAVPEASEAQLWQALERAAAGFVRQLPQGLDTVVGEQGVRLSGGERQRIALARALLGRPSLLILDEATSALDSDNEERIRQAIVNLHGDLTVVAIGHRMATLQHADQVVLMEAGQIIRQGDWHAVQTTPHPNRPAVVLANTA
ncbi:MAG: ABC transporter ATP-binding protein [Undibacterium sp.]|uniref:ABC transporter ATP-binding protein n=1 Tax=Undibacterium sp. TaxID=1914977 RepID=UPI00271A9BB2|nr:ABC transporter ATP-binding protein [Undibacterium sp.]MDO8652621.1 ABC transporter ATP-binding protein [Undibacterium sp.]